MDIMEILRSQGGIGAIASQLGIPEAQAQQGVDALLPSILNGFGNRVGTVSDTSPGGLGGLLETLGGADLTRNVVGPESTQVDKGNDILGHIFGSKDVSREVAGQAAQLTGLDPSLLKKMLPIVAMLAAGFLSSRSGAAGGSGGLGSILSQVLGSMSGGGNAGGLGGVLGSILGGRR